MSSIVEYKDGKFVTFAEFMLSESILPTRTSFGTDVDAKDGNFNNISNIYYTLVKEKGMYYLIYIDASDGEIGFGVNPEWSGRNTVGDVTSFTDRRSGEDLGAGALKVFGKIIYALLKLVKKTNSKSIKFNAAHPKLGKVYSRMVKNEPFLKALEKEGWEYWGMRQDDYLFTK